VGFGGGSDVIVPGGSTQYLAPGAYGNILVEKDGTLILHGINANSGAGRFDVRAVKVVSGGMLLADNPVIVNLESNLRLTGNAVLAPNPITQVQPGDLQFNVEGRGAKLGKGAFVQARVRAPNGKISVGRGTIAGGQFIAQKIVVQKEASLRLQGGCGDGEKQTTEVCDTSAPNGQAACPGNCIPLGEAGQCSCRCTTDAQCNDQNACNGVETCTQGHCALGTPLSCDDGNACTNDCNPATGCAHTAVADGTGCDDDNECTKSDKCLAGVCQPGTLRECNDGNDCTADSCDPEHGCEHDPVFNGTACSDGNACTTGEVCIGGQCKNASPKDCNDLNPCTQDSCDPILGCQHLPLTNGASCAGPNPCTALDICNAGACTSGLAQLCGPSNSCTVTSCTASGPAGSQTAECHSTPTVDCNDLNPCTIDTCNPQTGCQHAPVVNGSSCAGPSPCTALDVCNAGSCTSGVPQLCNDSNPCTTESCSVVGPVGSQTAQCNYAARPNQTPCGPNGQVCVNSFCQ
jgi:hypothetical protein